MRQHLIVIQWRDIMKQHSFINQGVLCEHKKAIFYSHESTDMNLMSEQSIVILMFMKFYAYLPSHKNALSFL